VSELIRFTIGLKKKSSARDQRRADFEDQKYLPYRSCGMNNLVLRTGKLAMHAVVLASFTIAALLHGQSPAQITDPNPLIREAAAKALGASHKRNAVPALIKALSDTNVHVRQAAATALGDIRDPRAISPLITALRNQSYGTCAASSTGQIITALTQIGWPAVASLLDALNDNHEATSASTVNYVVEALGGIHDPRLNDLLLSIAQNDSNPHVREHALEALAQIKDPSTVPALIAILNQDPAPPTPVPPGKKETAFSRALDDPTTGPRTRAEFALEAIATPEAIAALTAAQSSPNQFVSDNAKRFVAQRIPVATTSPTRSRFVNTANNKSQPVRQGDLRLEPSLLVELKDPNEDRRWRAADDLAKIQDPASIAPLLQALQTERQSSVRRHLIGALVEFPDPRAIDPIVSLIQHTDDHDDLFWTPRAIAESKNPLAVGALIQLLQAPRAIVREAGATGLAEMQAYRDPATIQPLINALKDPNDEVRGEAARALVNTTDRSAVPALIEALQDSAWFVRFCAAHALAHTGDPRAIPALLSLFATEEPNQTNSAAAALGEMTDPAALNAIVGALKSPNAHVRLLAAQVLRYRNDPHIYPALIRAEQDADPAVRQAATLALSGCPAPQPMD
jgi:HEAT repeat protein